ncbi:MAG: XRE family transcriptional regulator [Candidatus Jettenia sp.]|uniref:HTH cro/C1-type domain-containing protein n=1 Tax=Candidatus Jettenia caeni TaxID=247490 RepID=I3IK28_9BACT|nr:helix-turn-helix transcriptional regulator [Candidatus Jettenia sp. AMX1]MBC6928997.1 XRE family transcriptional regulator [Candidatus Jettenia sp.]NUN24576.1 helix-turn-helix transcriptional regulator [Candidatus Jettenia caeni]KAA0249226.1 MAG: XRE family transcriptional regulator [Candidatus Jettenia sp. AMX1]MCE7881102.1 XRE family transcriptional regulator [Candidatus Jettenia sp. AMX1]MCQ3927176.1 XRE family transcriptional regulator [Candidatus Jettenia sp.]
MKNRKKYPDLIQLGQNIRNLRKLKRFTQESLAFKTGIDRSYIGGIERGERNVSFLTLSTIAKCLSCDIAQLTKGIPCD